MAASCWPEAAGRRLLGNSKRALCIRLSAVTLLCVRLWSTSLPSGRATVFTLGAPRLVTLRSAPRAQLLRREAGSPAAETREDVKSALFGCLDRDGDGRLNSPELRSFAECTGFEGGADDWADEYGFLCGSMGCQASVGLDLPAFSRLVDDSSDDGCYCSDSELVSMLKAQRLASGAAPSVPAAAEAATTGVVARGTAGMEYFAQERKQGLYETSWKAWDPSEGTGARSPRVGPIPGMPGCSGAATAQEAVMFLYDQVQGGIFGDAGASVEERLSEALGLATAPSGGGSGWFDLRLSEETLGAEELAKLVLAPQGWPAEKAAIPKGYNMHILSVGRGVKATLCGRENSHIINALHRDVSKCGQLCDTCLCGVVGRKRVILFAPDEFHETSGWARKPDLTSHNLHTLTYLPDAEAWSKLEELASRSDVIGGVLTLEPGRFVFVPHGWWHAVQPVDGFTFITGPSRLSGLAAQT